MFLMVLGWKMLGDSVLVLTSVTTVTGQERLVSGSDDTTLKIWSTERPSGKWGALKPLTLGLFRSAGRSISPFWWCDYSDPSVFGSWLYLGHNFVDMGWLMSEDERTVAEMGTDGNGCQQNCGCLWKDIWNPGMVENSWQKSTRSVQTNWCHWIQWSWNGLWTLLRGLIWIILVSFFKVYAGDEAKMQLQAGTRATLISMESRELTIYRPFGRQREPDFATRFQASAHAGNSTASQGQVQVACSCSCFVARFMACQLSVNVVSGMCVVSPSHLRHLQANCLATGKSLGMEVSRGTPLN